jgi:hypothetical protein
MIIEILTLEDKTIILSQNIGHQSSSDAVLETSSGWVEKQVWVNKKYSLGIKKVFFKNQFLSV